MVLIGVQVQPSLSSMPSCCRCCYLLAMGCAAMQNKHPLHTPCLQLAAASPLRHLSKGQPISDKCPTLTSGRSSHPHSLGCEGAPANHGLASLGEELLLLLRGNNSSRGQCAPGCGHITAPTQHSTAPAQCSTGQRDTGVRVSRVPITV